MRGLELLEAMLRGIAKEVTGGAGPEKDCKRCARRHPSRRDCGLVPVERTAKSGRTVRWTHPSNV